MLPSYLNHTINKSKLDDQEGGELSDCALFL